MKLLAIPLLAFCMFLSGCALFGYDPPNLANGESAAISQGQLLAAADNQAHNVHK